MRKTNLFLIAGAFFGVGAVAIILANIGMSSAFSGPSNSAGSGSGSIAVDASGNISVGTTTLPGTARFYVTGSSTNSSFYSLEALDRAGTVLFAVRNDGKVGIGTTTFGSTSTLRVAGKIESTSGGFIFPDGSTQVAAASGNGAATSTAAGYITPGTFNSVANTGGTYIFPATLAVSTTLAVGSPTQPTGGVAFFNGNVGIGTSTPGSLLTVDGQLNVLLNRIVNVGTPTASSDAATKGYVDGLTASYNAKVASCSTSGCTASVTCDAGTKVIWAYSNVQDSNGCTDMVFSDVNMRIKAGCMGQTSCSQLEIGSANQACVTVLCAK